MDNRTRPEVELVAKSHKVGTNTLYRWIRAYEDTGLLTSLFPQVRSDRGERKLTEEAEAIIKEIVEDEYLSGQKKSDLLEDNNPESPILGKFINGYCDMVRVRC